MRGGKREGSGRKGFGATKTIRIPVELEAKVKGLIAEFKAQQGSDGQEKASFENVTKPKALVKPMFPILTSDQLKRLRAWLVDCKIAKTKAEARKMTPNPKLCRKTFRDNIHDTEDSENLAIQDIMELYAND